MPLRWTAEDIVCALRGESFHEQSWCARGLSIDSRTLKPGDLFVALQGPRFDGHDFVREAFDKGAVAAVVHHAPSCIAPNAPLIYVESTPHALWRLAEAGRRRAQAKIAAVTGSVGKTTTKELLRLMLGSLAETGANEGSQNNLIGVPMALSALPAEAAFGVFEVAQTPPENIGPLAEAIAPHVGLLTSIASGPMETYESAQAIAEANTAFFDGLAKDGTLILPRDTPHYGYLHAVAKAKGIKNILSFGRSPKATARLLDVRATEDGLEAEALIGKNTIVFDLSVKGEHFALDATAALLAVASLGADPVAAAESLSAFRPALGRGTCIPLTFGFGERIGLIDESFEATPDSVRAALKLLATTPQSPRGRRIAVLGDMQDYAPGAAERAANLVPDLLAAQVDLVFCCGEAMEGLANVLPPSLHGTYRTKSSDLVPLLAREIRDGDVVLVKGAQKLGLSDLVGFLRDLAKPALPENRLAC